MMGALKEWDLRIAKDEATIVRWHPTKCYSAIRIRDSEDVLELASGESLPFGPPSARNRKQQPNPRCARFGLGRSAHEYTHRRQNIIHECPEGA